MIKANCHKYSVSTMCRILQVNRSTYYYEAKQKKDKSLADLDNLPDSDILADDIIENLQSALESFQELKNQLK